MKIEIGESLACSWLRHTRSCWLVQANWKVAESWQRYPTDAALEELFRNMKYRFDHDGSVFKKTKDAEQFLKQGEIDVVGIDREGGVHAVEVAFHEAGLQYGTPTETNHRVLKKMLRTLLILRAFRPPGTRLHIYFLSPKVNPVVQQPLEETFALLKAEYPDVEWRLFANDDFNETVVRPTLEKVSGVADSSELFVRSAKLLELVDRAGSRPHVQRTRSDEEQGSAVRKRVQPLVKKLMRTLLVEEPALLSTEDRRDMLNNEYCKSKLGLQIGNLPLLRRGGLGAKIKEHNRYWVQPYGDFYVCKEWMPQYHHSNAQSLLAFVKDVAARNEGQPGVKALHRHEQAFSNYLADAQPLVLASRTFLPTA